jgi:hypothetical protein
MEVSRVVENRVTEIRQFYAQIPSLGQLEDIFISETVQQDGQRIYENLWLIFGNIWCEAHNFLLEDSLDFTNITEVNHLIIKKENYIPGGATTRSRLTLGFKMSESVTGNMKSSGENCDVLYRIIQTRIIPLMLTGFRAFPARGVSR